MKVINVEIFDMDMTAATGGRFPWNPVVIRVNTDEGVSGLGEVGLAYGSGHSAAVGMVKDLAGRFLIGADPLNSEKIWESMFRESFWGLGGGPVVYGGISAIDIALWDIKGKALGVPVYQLLGGKYRDRLRTYASQIQGGWAETTRLHVAPSEYAEVAVRLKELGFNALKVDPIACDAQGQKVAS